MSNKLEKLVSRLFVLTLTLLTTFNTFAVTKDYSIEYKKDKDQDVDGSGMPACRC